MAQLLLDAGADPDAQDALRYPIWLSEGQVMDQGQQDIDAMRALFKKNTVGRSNVEQFRQDGDGRFEITGSLERNATLSVSVIADGYAPLRMPHAWLPDDSPFDLGDLVIAKGHSISGKVVDEAGRPLGDVQVLMAIDRGVPGCLQSYPGRGIPLTRTDANGWFAATGVLPGRWR